jgi:hypothetical protein
MANEFLWKELSEREKEEAKKRAKEIMDNFADKLKDVKETKEDKENFKECARNDAPTHQRGSTPEGDKALCEKEINREIMFQNAPNKNKDFIIAETKKW